MIRDLLANRSGAMRILIGSVLVLCIASLCILPATASTDISGTWKSTYHVGPSERSIVGVVQQIGNYITGYYTTTLADGSTYPGIIHGVMSGDKVTAYYVALKTVDGKMQPASVIVTDLNIIDNDHMKGTLTVQDSTGFSGPVEGQRI